MSAVFYHYKLFLFVLLASTGLLACSGSSATSDVVVEDENGPVPTSSEAQNALDDALAAFNRYCIAPEAQQSTDDYPLTLVNPDLEAPSFQYRQLMALTRVGVLDTTITKSQGGLPVHQFSLTRLGRETQYEIAQARNYKSMFCYAVPKVTRVDSIKAVYSPDPDPLSRVWFGYRFTNLQRWVETPAIQDAFSGLPSLPSRETRTSKELLTRIDSVWMDRRLTGYSAHPSSPPPN